MEPGIEIFHSEVEGLAHTKSKGRGQAGGGPNDDKVEKNIIDEAEQDEAGEG
jgi:hypothetical protein